MFLCLPFAFLNLCSYSFTIFDHHLQILSLILLTIHSSIRSSCGTRRGQVLVDTCFIINDISMGVCIDIMKFQVCLTQCL